MRSKKYKLLQVNSHTFIKESCHPYRKTHTYEYCQGRNLSLFKTQPISRICLNIKQTILNWPNYFLHFELEIVTA